MRPDSWIRRRVFGVILPWIGWETWPCHATGEPAFVGLDGTMDEAAPFEADFLTLEWFGIGTTLMRGEVRVKGEPQ